MGRIGIRAERGAPRMTRFTRDEQYTMMTLWSIFKSPMMFGGNLPDNDAFTDSLLTNKGMLSVLKSSTNNRPLFNHPDQAAWTADEPGTGAKYLAVFNKTDKQLADPAKAIWKSHVINRQTPAQSKIIDIDLKGAKKLYLVADNSGDGIDWDHTDWINPVVYNDKDTLQLTQLKWLQAKSGWGSVRLNQSVSGGSLIVNNKTYSKGIGMHANGMVEFDLPEGYTHFKALVGLDKAAVEQNTGASIQAMVFTQNPSGPEPAASAKIKVDLKSLGLSSPCTITDLWTGKVVGKFTGEFAPMINRHGAGLYKITKAK
jgi:hypothetical protein